MVAKLFLLLACLALSDAGLVKRDADKAAATGIFDDIVKHAGEFANTFTQQLNAITTSKNTEEFQKVVKDGTDSVLTQMSSFSATLQGMLGEAQGKTKEALESTRASLERTVEELRKSHPEVEQQAHALKDKLQQAVQNAVQETQKLAKEASANIEETNHKLAPQIKAAYDDFVKQAQEVQKKVHEAATKQ